MAHVRTDAQIGVDVVGKKPFDWSGEKLGAFLDLASDSVLGTYVQYRGHYNTVQEIDAAYLAFLENLLNPPDIIAPLFCLQAHASYRAAVGLAMSGQCAPAFMALRGCLENSLYGLYFFKKPDTFEIWAKRHDDDAAKQRVRNEFTIKNMKECLSDVDADLAAAAAGLYDKTIDLGAHPNVAAMAGVFRNVNAGDRQQLQIMYLTARRENLAGTMKSVARTGLCSLLIFRIVFPERFNLLGISETLASLRRVL